MDQEHKAEPRPERVRVGIAVLGCWKFGASLARGGRPCNGQVLPLRQHGSVGAYGEPYLQTDHSAEAAAAFAPKALAHSMALLYVRLTKGSERFSFLATGAISSHSPNSRASMRR